MPANCCIKNNSGLTDVHLADAEITDLDDLLDIEYQSFPSPWNYKQFLAEFHKPYAHILVAHRPAPRTILGFIVFWHLIDELHILNLAVKPEARRQGLGLALLRHTLDLARDRQCQTAWLEVRPSNQAAIALYQSLGFKQVMIRKGYYGDSGEDALIFCLTLPGSTP